MPHLEPAQPGSLFELEAGSLELAESSAGLRLDTAREWAGGVRGCKVQTVAVFVLGFVLTVVIRVHVFKVDVFSHDLSSRVSWCDIHVPISYRIPHLAPFLQYYTPQARRVAPHYRCQS